MSLDKYKKSLSTCKSLLESDTLGSFDFFTSSICLDSVDTKKLEEFRKALVSNDFAVLAKVIPLAIHEYTHFIDSTSTLWGLKHLRRMSEAYSSNNTKGGVETNFYQAKEFLEHVRSLRLPKYYTLVNNSVDARTPWGFDITMGQQFGLDGKLSTKPILFARFKNSSGQGLARSPISTVSLLEASAMSQELMAKRALIDMLNGDSRHVESKIFEKESLSYIYNQNLTEYSVCVHILANHLQCTDILIAFNICAIITRISLNFPTSLIDTVLDNCEIHEILKIPKGHEFEDRLRVGLKNQNLGILYYLLCKSMPTNSAEKEENVLGGVKAALDRMGIEFDSLNEESKKEFNENVQQLSASKIPAIKTLASAAEKNFNLINFISPTIPFDKLSLPQVYLGDGEKSLIFSSKDNVFLNIDVDEIFNDLFEGQEWVERFSEACTA